VPYNPCGRVVDFGSGSYRTKCRFFKDSDLEIDILWYPVNPGTPCIDGESAISVWYNDREQAGEVPPKRSGVGEVGGRFVQRVKPQEKAAATGRHVCGTPEMFAEGATFDAAVNVLYRADGLPACCVQAEGLLLVPAPPRVAGGLLMIDPGPPAPPTYVLDPGLTGARTVFPAGAGLWLYSEPPANYTLQTPDPLSGHQWAATISISAFLSGVWVTDGWDGTGTRSFSLYSGVGYSGPLTVTRS
jgi:hypothetical protein